MNGFVLPLVLFFALICVLGSGSVVFVELESIAERPDSIALHSLDGDLSIFSHADFTMEMDVQAMSIAPLTFQSSFKLTTKTLVMATMISINGISSSSLSSADESAIIYAAAQATNITETGYHSIDTSEAMFVQHTTGLYNVSEIMIYTYLPKNTFGDNGHELIDLYDYTKIYFEQNVLNGMFRILLAEGGLAFSTNSFTTVKSASYMDHGYKFEYPVGYFDKGELLSTGDKAAIGIMSIIGFCIFILALYFLIVTFRAHRESIRDSLLGETKKNADGTVEHSKIYQRNGSIFAFSQN